MVGYFGMQRGRKRRFAGSSPARQEFADKVLVINRVAKKIKGGDKIGFTALVAVGNRKGKIGLGYGRARDLRSAIEKAKTKAKKNIFSVPLKGPTLPRRIQVKEGAGVVLLMPAPSGAGLIAGGVVRNILKLAGAIDASAKILGTDNPMTNAKATIKALKMLEDEDGAK
ncbi:MAG: 30S ribosomal protein S5 [Patescibacteria group bacterium]|nr:MAG: 30S ribosomal protein S5 [Patescibacteria group bacterium]